MSWQPGKTQSGGGPSAHCHPRNVVTRRGTRKLNWRIKILSKLISVMVTPAHTQLQSTNLLFVFLLDFWAIPISVQGLFLVQCMGITPGDAQKTIISRALNPGLLHTKLVLSLLHSHLLSHILSLMLCTFLNYISKISAFHYILFQLKRAILKC